MKPRHREGSDPSMITPALTFLMLSLADGRCAENAVAPPLALNIVAFYFGAHPDDWQPFMNSIVQ
jgi:hypothetical protein